MPHYSSPLTSFSNMIHLPLPWRPRATSATTSGGEAHCRGGTATSAAGTGSSSSGTCCGLSRLMKRLKKRSKMLQPSSRQQSLQCRYDPLSYSLNFDRSGSGDFLDDDYYKFCAFSSRFVVAPRTDCQRLISSS